MPLEVARHDTCLVWGCGKPSGARGMCWQHYKQAQREGHLIPMRDVEKIKPTCSKCHKRPALWLGLCRACYYKQNRKTSPLRSLRLARDRERKRKARG